MSDSGSDISSSASSTSNTSSTTSTATSKRIKRSKQDLKLVIVQTVRQNDRDDKKAAALAHAEAHAKRGALAQYYRSLKLTFPVKPDF